jgi:hypothetical protein
MANFVKILFFDLILIFTITSCIAQDVIVRKDYKKNRIKALCSTKSSDTITIKLPNSKIANIFISRNESFFLLQIENQKLHLPLQLSHNTDVCFEYYWINHHNRDLFLISHCIGGRAGHCYLSIISLKKNSQIDKFDTISGYLGIINFMDFNKKNIQINLFEYNNMSNEEHEGDFYCLTRFEFNPKKMIFKEIINQKPSCYVVIENGNMKKLPVKCPCSLIKKLNLH